MKEEFLWGGALSNVQAEGAYLEDGKGLNVYDTLVVTPEPGIEPMFCDTKVATDHYHHYQEDIDYMAQMGYKAYRFSVVWSRIHPLGNDSEVRVRSSNPNRLHAFAINKVMIITGTK